MNVYRVKIYSWELLCLDCFMAYINKRNTKHRLHIESWTERIVKNVIKKLWHVCWGICFLESKIKPKNYRVFKRRKVFSLHFYRYTITSQTGFIVLNILPSLFINFYQMCDKYRAIFFVYTNQLIFSLVANQYLYKFYNVTQWFIQHS